jgi:hypothetical protein
MELANKSAAPSYLLPAFLRLRLLLPLRVAAARSGEDPS